MKASTSGYSVQALIREKGSQGGLRDWSDVDVIFPLEAEAGGKVVKPLHKVLHAQHHTR